MKEKTTVFLGGTCASSTWREELIPMLNDNVSFFNPVVEDWTPECQVEEDKHRENDDICLYVITPEGEGFYSFVEVIDDSNKRPSRTVLCVLKEANGKEFTGHNLKCVLKTMKLAMKNGVKVTDNLKDTADYINDFSIKNNKQSGYTLGLIK